MSLALKLASLVMGLEGVNHTCYENSGSKGRIFPALQTEKRGIELNIATLEAFVK